MLSLEKRRYLFDVTFLYKALNIDLNPLLNFYSQADPYKFRHVDDYSLKLNFASTTKFKYSYFNRIVEMWSSLPLEIRLAPNSNVKKMSHIILQMKLGRELNARILMAVSKCSQLYFYSIIHVNNKYVFNIYIVFIVGDLSCMESQTLLQIILMACLFFFCFVCLYAIKL